MTPDQPARVIVELLRSGRPATFHARGSSMWPAVRDGALVEVTPCAAGQLRRGDIAGYERDGRVVVHRVVAADRDAVAFAGDAVRGPPERVAPEAVLGRARVIEQRQLRMRIPTPRALALLARHAWRVVRQRTRGGDC